MGDQLSQLVFSVVVTASVVDSVVAASADVLMMTQVLICGYNKLISCFFMGYMQSMMFNRTIAIYQLYFCCF